MANCQGVADKINTIYCACCDGDVRARLTNGSEIYPHRNDLAKLPFWKCDACGNYVGCHHKTRSPTTPLGIIPTQELRNARSHIHKVLDPIWKSGRMRRGDLYARMASLLGIAEYHTADIKSVSDARDAFRAALQIADQLAREE